MVQAEHCERLETFVKSDGRQGDVKAGGTIMYKCVSLKKNAN